MNPDLKTALNFIQQSTKLSADEKSNLSDAIGKVADELEYKNRELEIEAALEKVRAKTMAMQRSDELLETSFLLFQQFRDLGETSEQISIGIFNEEKNVMELYSTLYGSQWNEQIMVDLDEPVVMKKLYAAWKETQKSFVIDLTGDELLKYNSFRKKLSNRDYDEKRWVIHIAYFSKGVLAFSSITPHPEEAIQLLERFATVFDGTYTRFLDLKLAESQARESQIEAALERVRAKAMSMQKSDDLSLAVAIIFEELEKLNLGMLRCGIGILDKEKRCANVWTTTISEHGKVVQVSGDESMDIHPLLHGAFEAWLRQEDFSYVLEGEDLNRYYEALTHVNFKLPESQSLVSGTAGIKQYYHNALFQAGGLFAFRDSPFPAEAKAVMRRFADVFTLTYTRFNDLKVAEANAVNAQIEEQKLREEKKRSDSLLLNILPEEIANELKEFGKSYARKHEEVTILFCDIKGFSTIAENLSAEELVSQLDECFRAFDKIVEKHGLEKIKTVGDAYICACGLPKPVDDHAAKTVIAAMDMLAFLKGFNISKNIQNLPGFEFRIGIHTGPVVTGVVGLKKFTYDIWGDAVNMAARMEQHGEEGKINVSGNTYELIKDKFTCTYRGKIPAKNKGEVDMYFVEG